MKPGRRRALVVVIVGLVVVLTAIFVVDRASSVLFGKGLFSWPPMSGVLDGWVADGERQAALQATRVFSTTIDPSGTAEVASTQYTRCVEGEHDWQRRDDFRLSCKAYTATFRAWRGDFDSGGTGSRSALVAACGRAYVAIGQHPAPGSPPTAGEIYRCSDGIEVMLVFASTSGLTPIDNVVTQADHNAASRRVSGPTGAELVTTLSAYDWFAVYEVSKEFFRD